MKRGRRGARGRYRGRQSHTGIRGRWIVMRLPRCSKTRTTKAARQGRRTSDISGGHHDETHPAEAYLALQASPAFPAVPCSRVQRRRRRRSCRRDRSSHPAIARAQTAIKIGYVSPQSGPLAAFSEADDFVIAKMAKLCGRRRARRSRSSCGTASPNPNRAARSRRELIVNEGIALLVAASTPETTNPVATVAEIEEFPCITTMAPWQPWYIGRQGNPGRSGELGAVRLHLPLLLGPRGHHRGVRRDVGPARHQQAGRRAVPQRRRRQCLGRSQCRHRAGPCAGRRVHASSIRAATRICQTISRRRSMRSRTPRPRSSPAS